MRNTKESETTLSRRPAPCVEKCRMSPTEYISRNSVTPLCVAPATTMTSAGAGTHTTHTAVGKKCKIGDEHEEAA